MRALVVYDSHFGYTEKIARAIAAAFPPTAEVDVVHVGDPGSHLLHGYDPVIVGGPTEGHTMTMAMRQWLERLGSETLVGVGVAAFDTRVGWPKLISGSAAGVIAPHLERAGGHLLAEPESFIVHGKENPAPSATELQHAKGWARLVLEGLALPVG